MRFTDNEVLEEGEILEDSDLEEIPYEMEMPVFSSTRYPNKKSKIAREKYEPVGLNSGTHLQCSTCRRRYCDLGDGCYVRRICAQKNCFEPESDRVGGRPGFCRHHDELGVLKCKWCKKREAINGKALCRICEMK